MNLEEMREDLFTLNEEINSLIDKCEYRNTYNPGIEHDESNPDESMIYRTFSDIISHLYYANLMLNYLQKPIKAEGTITRSKRGHYKLNRFTLKRGDLVEILRHRKEDDEEKTPSEYWDLTFVGGIHEIEDLQARLRK